MQRLRGADPAGTPDRGVRPTETQTEVCATKCENLRGARRFCGRRGHAAVAAFLYAGREPGLSRVSVQPTRSAAKAHCATGGLLC